MTDRKNPQTSIDAYKSLEPDKVREMYQRIMDALFVLKQATYEDISKQMKVDASRVWKRLSEMERMELIHRPGAKKKLSSGRQGYLWELTIKGTPTVQDHSRKIQTITNEYRQLNLL